MVIRIVRKRENIGQIWDGLDVGSAGLADELDGVIKEKKTQEQLWDFWLPQRVLFIAAYRNIEWGKGK